MRIVWDEAKRLKNLRPEPDGHRLDFPDVKEYFGWDDVFVVPGHSDKDGRGRLIAIGRFGNALSR